MCVLFCQISQRAQHFCGTEHGRSGGKTFFKFAKKNRKAIKKYEKKGLTEKSSSKNIKIIYRWKMRIYFLSTGLPANDETSETTVRDILFFLTFLVLFILYC